jgi:hypothetical protein
MLWSKKRPDRASDPVREELWRKTLISRLSDAQVAVWASEPQLPDHAAGYHSVGTQADPRRDETAPAITTSSIAQLYATPETIFTGYAHAPQPRSQVHSGVQPPAQPRAAYATRPVPQAAAPAPFSQMPEPSAHVGSAPITSTHPMSQPTPQPPRPQPVAPSFQRQNRATATSAPDANKNPYSAWDDLDEQRRLAAHARLLTAKYRKRARAVSMLTAASVTTVAGALGLVGFLVMNQPVESLNVIASAAEVNSDLLQTPTEQQATMGPLVDVSGEPLDAPTLAPGQASIEATVVPVTPVRFVSEPLALQPHTAASTPVAAAIPMAQPTRNVPNSAERIATLLGERPAKKDVATQIADFSEGRDTSVLAPVTTLIVNEKGEAAFPFTLNDSGTETQGARVMLQGLPKGIALAVGQPNAHGLWVFELADLPEQRLIVADYAAKTFELRLGVLLARGDVVGATPLLVRLERKGPAARVSPKADVKAPAVVVTPAIVKPVPTSPAPQIQAKVYQHSQENRVVAKAAARPSKSDDDDEATTDAPAVAEAKPRGPVKSPLVRAENPMALGATPRGGDPNVGVRVQASAPPKPVATTAKSGTKAMPEWLPNPEQ